MKHTHPQDPRIRQAIALHQAGKLVEAAQQMKELLNFFPQNTLLLTHLGTILLQQGDREAGVRMLGKSLKLEPSQPMALLNCANGLTSLGRVSEALKLYDQVISLRPFSSNLIRRLGIGCFVASKPGPSLLLIGLNQRAA